MTTQSFKAPEKGDKLNQYTIKLSLIHQQIGFPQIYCLLSLVQLFFCNWKQYMAECHRHELFG